MARGKPRKPRLSRMDAAVDAMARLGFAAERVTKNVKALLREYGGDEAWPFIEEYSYKELIEALLREPEEDDNQEKDTGDGLCLKDKFLENGTVAGTSSGVSDTCPRDMPGDGAPVDTAMPSGEVAEPTDLEPVSYSSDHHCGNANETVSVRGNGNSFVDETALETSSGVPDIRQDERPNNNAVDDTTASSGAVARTTTGRLHNHSQVEKGWEHIFIDYSTRNNIRETSGGSRKNSKNQGTELLHHGSKNPKPAVSNIPSPLPTNTHPMQRRIPCYGWIENDENDDACDFISLQPSLGKLGAKAASYQERTKRVTFAIEPKRIRRSRWDVKPDDP